ncbi:type IV toxin-antitoxin system AbiEi family antitoxin domain-containing protein [Acidicapsa dinghuensis]|uniref:Type IV toxin-antitoxin system AbiEi family antitoxin domain-containing protein n=1 Tax=Acidicapsa dinghuensis TaxID=2218256 RepID=A0ABW1EEC4_9BACT
MYRFWQIIDFMETKADRIAGEVRQRKIVRPKDLSSLAGSRSHLWNLAKSGKLERIGRGLYRDRNSPISDKEAYVELAKRVPLVFYVFPLRFVITS